MASASTTTVTRPLRQALGHDDWLMRSGLLVLGLWLTVTVIDATVGTVIEKCAGP